MSGTMMGTTNLKMKFEVEEVTNIRQVKRIGRRRDDGVSKGLEFHDEPRVLDRAWMVYFPAGHSMLIESEEELVRLGFKEAPPVVDMVSGEEMPVEVSLSPKEMVKRATNHRRAM